MDISIWEKQQKQTEENLHITLDSSEMSTNEKKFSVTFFFVCPLLIFYFLYKFLYYDSRLFSLNLIAQKNIPLNGIIVISVLSFSFALCATHAIDNRVNAVEIHISHLFCCQKIKFWWNESNQVIISVKSVIDTILELGNVHSLSWMFEKNWICFAKKYCRSKQESLLMFTLSIFIMSYKTCIYARICIWHLQETLINDHGMVKFHVWFKSF